MKLGFSGQIFEKIQKNTYSGCRVVPCGQTADMTKLMVAFRNFANESKTACVLILCMLTVIHREIIHTAWKLIVCMLTVVGHEIQKPYVC